MTRKTMTEFQRHEILRAINYYRSNGSKREDLQQVLAQCPVWLRKDAIAAGKKARKAMQKRKRKDIGNA